MSKRCWQFVFGSTKRSHENFFSTAANWYEDMYDAVIVSRNRYRLLSLGSFVIVFMLLLVIATLLPLQHMVPLMVNHYTDGRVDVQPIANTPMRADQSMINSDIVRYVVNRQSFEAHAFSSQYQLISIMSSPRVSKQYQQQQSAKNKHSPLSQLSTKAYRDVYIDSVVVLDRKNNLAQVNFVQSDHQNERIIRSQPMAAIVRWQYRKPSQDPAVRWLNWDGFSVEQYHVVPRHVA